MIQWRVIIMFRVFRWYDFLLGSLYFVLLQCPFLVNYDINLTFMLYVSVFDQRFI